MRFGLRALLIHLDVLRRTWTYPLQVYSDLRVAFAISENQDFLKGLTSAGELTVNRPPILAQLYYQVRTPLYSHVSQQLASGRTF